MALLALGACAGEDAGAARDQIAIVGSSTVYPFTTAVAEAFARKNPGMMAPKVEATGTGAGMKLFCAGIGARFPDIENASRRIKKSEVADCAAHGVTSIVEIQIGIDGIALGQSNAGPAFALTERQVYRALAAAPFGRPQAAATWRDVDPALPPVAIRVYGPPPTSGTRDAFAELVLEKGCRTDPAMEALKARDEDAYKAACTRLREDGAFIEAGENDNLIVQKLAADPDALGVFGYSFLEENRDRLHGIPLQGVPPTAATIARGDYPGARPLYLYVKSAHLDVIPGLRRFVAEYAASWRTGGLLARRGLLAAPPEVQARNAAIAATLTPMDTGSVK